MADIVTVKTEVDYCAWPTPDSARLAMSETDYADCPAIEVELVAPEVLDALAMQWLDHLYARCNRANPFKLDQSRSS